MKVVKGFVIAIGAMLIMVAGYAYLSARGHLGDHQGPGSVTGTAIPDRIVFDRSEAKKQAGKNLGGDPAKQILFGDFHVHTTFSKDAYTLSLPLVQGEGGHPPADACDFARFCSALDFWSINDHAEAITPRRWTETKESIRQCNAVTDPDVPDVVAFLGYEWTQSYPASADLHYGHKNVIYRDTAEEKVPPRAIGSRAPGGPAAMSSFKIPLAQAILLPLIDSDYFKRYMNLNKYNKELTAVTPCPEDVNTNDLPVDCMESTVTPEVLFTKLDQGGYESIVIPHGNSWGSYSPPDTTWDKQLAGKMHDPKRQTLFELFSGHGNSEEYRSWQAISYDADGYPLCPGPSDGFIPNCRRAGEIIKERCMEAGGNPSECDTRAAEARQNFVASKDHLIASATISGQTGLDWLDSGQCADCFLPPYNHRPGGSAQYALAISNFDDPENPRRFRFGFIGSSDNHTARGGTGYKEYARREMTEATAPRSEFFDKMMKGDRGEPIARSLPSTGVKFKRLQLFAQQSERLTSFLYTGGLMAVHAEGRNRESIWKAVKRKEVYSTSGDRILLWFDLVNAPQLSGEKSEGDKTSEGRLVPMGGETEMNHRPRFHVRAIGAFKQKPGCPTYSINALSPERLDHLCKGECYNPGDERKRMTRIEVIRIRPQKSPDEPVDGLIEDVWKSFSCPPDSDGCEVWFEDEEFSEAGRDTVYYVRAIEEPSPTVNADTLRCEYDENGNCIKSNPCYETFPGNTYEDDCLAESEERAWSSPIFVDFKQMDRGV